ncbi:GTPase RsgA [Actinoplanes sp. SE50]|uniref:ribosome small subunit-dependent GTPase A n=1 Tax=unclassified Actinoplanes TaxID=2626549 RepID=UPI00023ED1C5|nr:MULTISPECIES: ribosome small subunit-dependent GTPase A [unclassified Actinoplanes]AEV82743.1 ribosome biogenesis GTPase [Actinoplanes sp. SE50/110]ATO81139.1 GTPase RsgA [Actinoplanes sp. SE50]SLL98546.1 ribosome small subunit-dependent GTPase A [Actinoplanes sp. SE50/110]
MSYDLSQLGWDELFVSAFRPYDRADSRPGRVLRADRGVSTVLTANGVTRASLGGNALLDAARDPSRLPCSGDWVVLRDWPDRRVTLELVLPRRTTLIRRTADKDSSGQVLAANMDTVAVVEPIFPEPGDARVERLLALAWESGADPVLVLTKSDTTRDPRAVARQLGELAPGVPVLPVSVQRGTGLEPLRELAGPGRTLALLGRSGAGKSTLANALAGASVMPVQAIRDADGKGRHTTAYRSLVTIPGGGGVIDTPGIRGVGLLDTGSGLERAFADVTELAGHCRFDDCGHESEPGCAVQAALGDGSLPPRRLASWRKLHREVVVQSRRRTVRLATAPRRRDR